MLSNKELINLIEATNNYLDSFEKLVISNPKDTPKIKDSLQFLQTKLDELEDIQYDLEQINENQYGYFKYKTANICLDYLQLTDNEKKKYEKTICQFQIDYQKYLRNIEKEEKDQQYETNTQDTNYMELDQLRQLSDQIKIEIQQKLVLKNFSKLSSTSIKEFKEYNSIYKKNYEVIYKCLRQLLEGQRSQHSESDYINLNVILNNLKDQYDSNNYQFYLTLSEDKDFKDKYYGNPLTSEQDFLKRYRSIIVIISPDKYNHYFKGDKYQKEALALMRELTNKNNKWKEEVETLKIQEFREKNNIEKNEKIAEEFFEKANAIYSSIKTMDEDPKNKEKVQNLQIYAQQALLYYKKAMKIADIQNDSLESSIKSRNKISLCYYFMGDMLRSQLYIIGSLQNVYKNQTHSVFIKLLQDTKSTLNLINNNMEKSDFNSQEQIKEIQIQSNEIALYQHKEIYYFTKDYVITSDLIVPARYQNLVDCSIDKYIKIEQQELQNKDKILMYNAGLAIVLGEVLNTLSNRDSKLGILGTVSLVSLPFLFLYNKYGDFFKFYSQKYKNILNTKRELEKIVGKALESHKKQDYKSFLKILSQPFNKQPILQLIKFNEGTGEVGYDDLIPTLLKNGFSPNMTAYIMLLLGDAILLSENSDKVQKSNQIMQSKLIYWKIIHDQEIKKSASEMDIKIGQIIATPRNIIIEELKDELKYKTSKINDENDYDNFIKISQISIALHEEQKEWFNPFEEKVGYIQEVAIINYCYVLILEQRINEAVDFIKNLSQNRKQLFYQYSEVEDEMNLIDLLCILDTKFTNHTTQEEVNQQNQECETVQRLKQLISSNQESAKQFILTTISDPDFILETNKINKKQFYYYCTRFYYDLKDSKATRFYAYKFLYLQGINKQQEDEIKEILAQTVEFPSSKKESEVEKSTIK